MNDQALDDLARRVLLDAANLEWGDAIRDETEHTFSRRFEKRMKRVIQRADHPIRYYAARTLTAVLLVVFLGGGSVLALSTDARAAFIHWAIEWYDTQIIYRFSGEPAEDPNSPLPRYEVTALPEGYELFEDAFITPGSYNIGYANADGQLFWFGYQRMEQGGALVIDDVTGHGMTACDVTVNGCKGWAYCSQETEPNNMIVWIDEERNLLFDVSGFFDKDELLRIAESVSLCDVEK